ncbi:MAG: hypothetical protein LBD41_08160 [Clostridiales Family XIII bacterium]|nr:hypothetical protein [Clostridiales Family XIII bacterium]
MTYLKCVAVVTVLMFIVKLLTVPPQILTEPVYVGGILAESFGGAIVLGFVLYLIVRLFRSVYEFIKDRFGD